MKKEQQVNEYVMLMVLCGMMMPFPIACAVLVLAVCYFLIRMSLRQVYRWTKVHQAVHLWFVIALIASLLSQNVVGLAALITVYIFYIYLLYYRYYASVDLVERFIDIMLRFSVFHAGYAYLQHKHILYGPDYNSWHSALVSWKDGRADSVFLNPNYYAMACGFFMLLAGYKLVKKRQVKQVVYYSGIIIVNCMGLLFTQTRIAIPAILVSCLVFLWSMGGRKTKKYMLYVCLLALMSLPVISHLPRFRLVDMKEHFDIRLEIWRTSVTHFVKTGFIGSGPLTYMSIYKQYGTYATQHAHNLLLDTLLNYGVLGTGALGVWVWAIRKPIRQLKQTGNAAFYALVLSFITLTLTFGMMDVTIFWVQTLFIFMSILMVMPVYIRGK